MRERLIEQVLNRYYWFLFRDGHRVGWNYRRRCQNGISEIPRQGILRQELLQLQVGLGDDQILLARRNFALCSHNFNWGERSNFYLLTIVRERTLRKRNRPLLCLNIFVRIYQVPIDVLNLAYGGDHLQTEGDVRNLAVVAGDADQAIVLRNAEAL